MVILMKVDLLGLWSWFTHSNLCSGLPPLKYGLGLMTFTFMILIAYLNENFTDCNEKLAWGKLEPLIHPYVFWYKTKGEKVAKTSFYILFM